MRKFHFAASLLGVASAVAVIGQGGSVSAATITDLFNGISLQSLITNNDTVQVGNLAFSGFQMTGAQGFVIPPNSGETESTAAASAINVQDAPGGLPGIMLSAAWNTSQGSMQAQLSYTVTALDPAMAIDTVTDTSNAQATGGAFTQQFEVATVPPSSSPQYSVQLTQNVGGTVASNQGSVNLPAPSHSLNINETIGAYPGEGPGNATISMTQNTFTTTAVPEPATLVVAASGAAMLLLPRRKRRNQRAA